MLFLLRLLCIFFCFVGHLFQLMGDPAFGIASSFPMLSHPAFRLYSTLSGSPFGGLGTLGMPGALPPHAQLGAFPGISIYISISPSF